MKARTISRIEKEKIKELVKNKKFFRSNTAIFPLQKPNKCKDLSKRFFCERYRGGGGAHTGGKNNGEEKR
jgi:hypothetical protein